MLSLVNNVSIKYIFFRVKKYRVITLILTLCDVKTLSFSSYQWLEDLFFCDLTPHTIKAVAGRKISHIKHCIS